MPDIKGLEVDRALKVVQDHARTVPELVASVSTLMRYYQGLDARLAALKALREGRHGNRPRQAARGD